MTDQAGSVLTGNPAAEAAPGETATTTATTTTTASTGTDWSAALDEGSRSIVTTKGWKSPGDVVTSYSHLEKLLGADKAGRAIVPPKDDAPPEEYRAFRMKLGMPEKPEGYGITAPEGVDPAFAGRAAAKFHEIGFAAKDATQLMEWYNAEAAASVQAEENRVAQEQAVGLQKLRESWGNQFDAQAELARRAVREAAAAGLTAEDASLIERTLGVEKASKVFALFGSTFREAPMHGTEGQGQGRFGPMTPEAAKARITALTADTEWATKFAKGDADAAAEWRRLHTIAYATVS